jgi:hypothetical protein
MPGNLRTPIRWHGLSLPKRGHNAEEYEDAFAANAPAGRFAVADGASESSFATLWARLLVDGFVRPVRQRKETGWLAPLQQQWAAEVDGRPLPWYAEAKRQEGAFATLLGLVLQKGPEKPGGLWHALAIGDSCLFQVRQGSLLKTFPVTSSQDFGDRPPLRKRPWEAVGTLARRPSPPDTFAAWVEQLREQDGLRNDDVTLITITLGKLSARGKGRRETASEE